MNSRFAIPEYTTSKAIKNIRKQLKLTQKEFSILLNCSKATIERWERSDEPITGPIVLAIKMLEQHPEWIQEIVLPDKLYPIRLHYMHNQRLCTLIDVDEAHKRIKIVNYTDNVMFRAFGMVENPDYDMYTEFLESRCFPESRDKLKLVLEDLDLPFYDPFMIIEKTEGRMAEDDFWIKIER
ncbi:MAG: helix-turn-helix domain-containing protein [Lachnospiraceae bacterium]|nr:helix-turn-helix domain-containing protein [Lachnospiraceae bacterium]